MYASAQIESPFRASMKVQTSVLGVITMGTADDLAPARGRSGATLQPWPQRSSVDRPLVLVVDDEPINRLVASNMLSSIGAQPLLGCDGAEAVALARDVALDLILMDLQMPVLDGFQATEQIRRFEREHSRARVPVVAYTSTFVRGDLTLLRASGIDALLEKPCDVQAIRECVGRWCRPRAAQLLPGHDG